MSKGGCMKTFAARFRVGAAQRSPFCLGLDPSTEALKLWGLPDSHEGLRSFAESYVEWSSEIVLMVKPQMAFFERFGSFGLAVLEDAIGELRRRNVLVLMDAKRGDIGSTMFGYAEAYFDEASPLRVDAVTANPFLGFESLIPLIEKAGSANGHVFVVVLSSNVEGSRIQNARLDNGRRTYQHLGDEIVDYNARRHGAGAVGAVIGATRDDIDTRWLQDLGSTLQLRPGIGAQGASIEQLMHLPNRRSIIPSSSRAISQAGPVRAQFQSALRVAAEQAAQLWG
jgi:orotidine-5'-phosphate decarboxylase